ncbi:hypothetical protein RB200_02015 [Streptomyces sp. PmtG]
MDYIRHAKGALAATVATAACHTVMSGGYAWARDAKDRDPDAWFAGATQFVVTTLASWALMPLLLWAVMRLTRETGTQRLVVVGSVVWLGLSGYSIDAIDQSGGHMPVPALVSYVLIGALLAGHRSDSGTG